LHIYININDITNPNNKTKGQSTPTTIIKRVLDTNKSHTRHEEIPQQLKHDKLKTNKKYIYDHFILHPFMVCKTEEQDVPSLKHR
jgi:hypothetical protein